MITLKFETIEQLNAKIASLFMSELGDKPAKILEGMKANNTRIEKEVAKMVSDSEKFAKTAPVFLQTGIVEQTKQAIEAFKTEQHYQDPLPTIEMIAASLLEDKVKEVRDALGVEVKTVTTRVRKTAGDVDAGFNNIWAVKLPNGILAVNFRKLSVDQKGKFKMTNATQWLVFGGSELGYKVEECTSPTGVVKLAYNNLAGHTGNMGRHPWDSAKQLTEQEISVL